MRFDQIAELVAHIPHTRPEQGRILYDFVLDNDIERILELGFAHGVSTCYMAAALQEKGTGVVRTLDIPEALERDPNIHALIERAGFEKHIEPVICDGSYTWTLLSMIEEHMASKGREHTYDFCFIDGAHSWEVDGFAFFEVDRLLRPGGWLLFDDLDWSYERSPMLRDKDFVRAMSPERRSMRQVSKVFDLLVRPHPSYHNFRVEAGWGWAEKKAMASGFRLRRR